MMLKKSFYLAVAGWGSLLLSGCGGGAGGPSVAPPVVPPVTPPALEAQLLANNQVHLIVKLGTDSTISAYCLRTDAVTPAASDACFSGQTTQDVSTTGSATQSTQVRFWTKTNVGDVKKSLELSLPGKTCSADAYLASKASNLSTVCLITDKGEMVFALENTKAPGTVKNFLRYVNEGFYNGTHVHRIASNFVVQGGGFVWDGANYTKKTATYAGIPLESTDKTKLSNVQYSLAMARGTALDSATSEFFINLVDNKSLDTTSGGYAVFGAVIWGQATTLSAMAQTTVKSSTIISGENSLPVTPPALQWVYQIK